MRIQYAVVFFLVVLGSWAQEARVAVGPNSAASNTQSGFRLLVPDPNSKTAMVKCPGVDLEGVKAANNLSVLYVFDGTEDLKGMQFCIDGVTKFDNGHTYRVPPGTKGWKQPNGALVVLEGCVNLVTCFTCKTPEPTPSPAVVPEPEPQPQEPAPQPEFPTKERRPRPVPEPQPAPEPDVCPLCASIMSSYPLSQLGPKSGPIEVWPEIRNGKVVSGVWTFNGQVVSDQIRATLSPRKLHKLVHGKAGTYFLRFIGEDEHGHVVACGSKGSPLTLVRQGRHWFWKLPAIHCFYAFTKGIADWSTAGTLEKVLACPAEAAFAWWLLPSGGAVGVKTAVAVKSPL